MTEIRGSLFDIAVAALATVTLLLLASFIRTKASRKSRRQLPPGPRGWPVLGSIPELGTLLHRSLYELSKQYGPLMWIRLGSVKTVVVTSHRLAEVVLKTHDKVTASRPGHMTLPSRLLYNGLDMVLAPYGEYWRDMRKVCTLELLTTNRLSQFREIREGEVMALLHLILEESKQGNAVNMQECFGSTSYNNITKMVINRSYGLQLTSGPNSTSVHKEVKEWLSLYGAFNVSDYIPVLKPFDLQGLDKRGKAMHQKLDTILEQIIDEHRQRRSMAESMDNTESYKEDFVDALLGHRQTKGVENLSMDSVKAILLDMIVAGVDTSAITAHWILSELVKHPHVLRRVQEELDSVVGPHRLVQEEDFPKLQYLNAVVKETLRLHPPGPLLIPHVSTEDLEIEQFHIPARTQIFVNAWAIQRDPALWERPEEFYPDRFLNSSIDFKGQHFEFLPFGSGRRMCPGMNLGLLMATYPIALLVHALDWALPEGEKPEELDMSENLGAFLSRSVPLRVFVKARLPHHVLYPTQEVKK